MRRFGLGAIALLALGWLSLMQAPGANQNAHFALVRSLADGSPRIDRYRNETGDTAYVDGHYYAAKAPGLALVTVPWYLGLRASGVAAADPVVHEPFPEAQSSLPRAAVWQVGIFGATLAAFVLLLLVRGVVERFVPGYGTVAAITLGAGSLLGIFATLFFAHALSACLGFAAFALLVNERHRPPSLGLVAAAGALAGLAIATELPLAIVAAVVGLYAAWRDRPLRRALGYAGGLLVGLVPLLAYDLWAFGSPTALPYVHAVKEPGASGHDVLGANSSGFFGVGIPSVRNAVELLFSSKGLLVVAPVWALATVGLVVLWRGGRRAEAAVVGGVAACFLLYDAAYDLPFAGFPTGPRLLVPMLPFLALPVAAAWRLVPGVAAALAIASIVVTSVATLAEPIVFGEDPGSWFHRLERGEVTRTIFHRALGDGFAEIVPVVLLFAAAVVIALLLLPSPRIDVRGLLLAAAALVAWRAVYVGAPILLNEDRAAAGFTGLLAVVGVVAAIALGLVLLVRGAAEAAVVAAPAALVAWPAFAAHRGLALATVGTVLLALLVVAWRRRRGGLAVRTS